MNVDWYQPYKNRKCSVGVMYMVVLNLPREIHYKRENVILVGLTLSSQKCVFFVHFLKQRKTGEIWNI